MSERNEERRCQRCGEPWDRHPTGGVGRSAEFCIDALRRRVEACERSRKRLSDRAYDAEAQRDALAEDLQRASDLLYEVDNDGVVGEELSGRVYAAAKHFGRRAAGASAPKPAKAKPMFGIDQPISGQLGDRLAATPDAEREIEPGEFICDAHCPCCGAALEVTHGDDPGEISVIGEPSPDAERERRRDAVVEAAMAWKSGHGRIDDVRLWDACRRLAELDGGDNDA